MKTIISTLIVSCGIISGCVIPKPISTAKPKNNNTYEVEYLFEHDGCKIYRFKDCEQLVYFTNCESRTEVRSDSTLINQNVINRRDPVL